jgi:hypothetical protein
LSDFGENEWICRPDIRIFRDFAANEWVRRPDIRIFRDFAIGRGTWYSYSIDILEYFCAFAAPSRYKIIDSDIGY